MKLVNVGFGNYINADRIISVVTPESAPIKRIVQNSKEKGTLIDVSQGRKTQSVILMDSDNVILSYMDTDHILTLFEKGGNK